MDHNDKIVEFWETDVPIFSRVAYDQSAPSMSGFLQSVPPDEKFFPYFVFREVNLRDVKSAIGKSTSQARGCDGIP